MNMKFGIRINYSLFLACIGIILLTTVASPCQEQKQRLLDGYVIDQQNKPLPWSHVGVMGKRIGTYCDDTGHFTLKANETDTLLISFVGYEPLQILVSNFTGKVKLTESATMLREVQVRAQPIASIAKEWGYHRKRGVSLVYTTTGQFATWVANEKNQPALVKEVYYRLDHHANDGATRIRVRLYARDPNTGKPGEDLLRNNVMIDIPANQSLTKIDLSSYLVTVPKEGLYVGMDFIGFVEKNGKLKETTENRLGVRYGEGAPATVTYEKDTYGRWKLPSAIAIHPGENAMFGIQVLIEE